MEYHDQPLQFISNNFLQEKNRHHGVYRIISLLIFAISQYPLFVMPFIGFLTFRYLYPKILNCLVQHILIEHSSKVVVYTKTMFLFCLSGGIMTINGSLLVAHVGSLSEFIGYGKKVFDDYDRNMQYIHAAFSGSGIVIMLLFALGYQYYRVWMNYEEQPGDLQGISKATICNVIALFTTSISINIIYILCYFLPFMLLAFLHDPVATVITYFFVICFHVGYWLVFFMPMFKMIYYETFSYVSVEYKGACCNHGIPHVFCNYCI